MIPYNSVEIAVLQRAEMNSVDASLKADAVARMDVKNSINRAYRDIILANPLERLVDAIVYEELNFVANGASVSTAKVYLSSDPKLFRVYASYGELTGDPIDVIMESANEIPRQVPGMDIYAGRSEQYAYYNLMPGSGGVFDIRIRPKRLASSDTAILVLGVEDVTYDTGDNIPLASEWESQLVMVAANYALTIGQPIKGAE
jgi:hypothetical protein